MPHQSHIKATSKEWHQVCHKFNFASENVLPNNQVKWPLYFVFPVLQMKNSTRSVSAINSVAMEDKHDTVDFSSI